jgi:hypothetical protein
MEDKLNNTESFKIFICSGYQKSLFLLSQKETFVINLTEAPRWTPLFLYNTSSHFQAPFTIAFNPLTPELNPSAQRCLTRYFTGDFST